MKKVYQAPKLHEIGSVRELTLGSRDGDSLDANFAIGTPRGHLTFS